MGDTLHSPYVAPFALANREEDYRIAWAFFEKMRIMVEPIEVDK